MERLRFNFDKGIEKLMQENVTEVKSFKERNAENFTVNFKF